MQGEASNELTGRLIRKITRALKDTECNVQSPFRTAKCETLAGDGASGRILLQAYVPCREIHGVKRECVRLSLQRSRSDVRLARPGRSGSNSRECAGQGLIRPAWINQSCLP